MNISVRVDTAPAGNDSFERVCHKRRGPQAAATYAGHLQTQKRPVVAMAATYPSESMSARLSLLETFLLEMGNPTTTLEELFLSIVSDSEARPGRRARQDGEMR